MRKMMIAIALLLVTTPLRAQDAAARDSVLAVVRQVFDAMRTRDSALARRAFTPNAFLTTVMVRQGVTSLSVDSLEQFIRFVGSPRSDVVDERLRNEIVHIDGALAVVWTDYSLWVGPRFSHCGVDAIQLIRLADGWQIFALADTRRRQNCPDAPAQPAR